MQPLSVEEMAKRNEELRGKLYEMSGKGHTRLNKNGNRSHKRKTPRRLRRVKREEAQP